MELDWSHFGEICHKPHRPVAGFSGTLNESGKGQTKNVIKEDFPTRVRERRNVIRRGKMDGAVQNLLQCGCGGYMFLPGNEEE